MPLTYDVRLGAGVRSQERGMEGRKLLPQQIDVPETAWITVNLPAPGGPTTAQELPAFVQAPKDRIWPGRVFPEVLGEPAPSFYTLPWSIFGWNRGELVPSGPRLDVRDMAEPNPAPALPILPLILGPRNAGDLIAPGRLLDPRGELGQTGWLKTSIPVPPPPFDPTLVAALGHAGDILSPRIGLDIRYTLPRFDPWIGWFALPITGAPRLLVRAKGRGPIPGVLPRVYVLKAPRPTMTPTRPRVYVLTAHPKKVQ